MEGCRSEEIVKVMAREGQLSRIKMVCRQEEEEEEDKEEEEESRLVSVQGERCFFYIYIFKTRNRVFSWEGWGTLGKWGR